MSVSTRAIVGVLVVSAALAAGLLVSPSTTFGLLESLAADPYLFGVALAGLYLVRPLFAWPTTPLAIVVGYGYGVALGLPIALFGVVVTVVPVFLAARWVVASESSDTSRPSAGSFSGLLERAGDTARRYYRTAGPIRGVIVSRLAPIPSDVSTCAAAASDVRLRQFVVGTLIGELPWTGAAVVVGASAATITTDGLGELGLAVAIACGLAGIVLLAGPLYRVVRTRSAPDTGSSLES